MAAVISIGTATDIVDLLKKLVVWLEVDRGYTTNMSQADGLGWRAHLSKSGVFINLRASISVAAGNNPWASNYVGTNNTGLNFYMSTGWASANAWNAQPGGPTQSGNSSVVGCCIRTGVGAIASYQFIDDGLGNIFVLVEVSPGVWRRMCWGTIVKYGSWPGGLFFESETPGYYCGLNLNDGIYLAKCPFSCGLERVGGDVGTAFVQADIDSFTGKWLSNALGLIPVAGYTGKLFTTGITGSIAPPSDVPVLDAVTQARLVSSLSARIVTVAIPIYAKRDASGYSAIGEIPSLRLCIVSERGTSIGTDVPVGAETWRIFNGFAVRIA